MSTIVSFKISKKLHELGYPQNGSTHSYFVGDGKLRFCKVGELLGHPVKEGETHKIAAPTISNILDWLRNNKDIHVNITLSKEYEEDGNWNVCNEWVYWTYNIQKVSTGEIIFDYDGEFDAIQFQTYELAAHDAIVYILNNLILDETNDTTNSLFSKYDMVVVEVDDKKYMGLYWKYIHNIIKINSLLLKHRIIIEDEKIVNINTDLCEISLEDYQLIRRPTPEEEEFFLKNMERLGFCKSNDKSFENKFLQGDIVSVETTDGSTWLSIIDRFERTVLRTGADVCLDGGEVCFYTDPHCNVLCDYVDIKSMRYATPDEKEIFIKICEDNGYKFEPKNI